MDVENNINTMKESVSSKKNSLKDIDFSRTVKSKTETTDFLLGNSWKEEIINLGTKI